MYKTSSPVLLILFNRPEQSAKVYEAIRKVQPRKLYLAIDAPRHGRDGEAQKCELVLNIFTNIDWPCEVYRKIQKQNIGCDVNVVTAVDWLFENEESGIVLEDDCIPNESFFRYCDELLKRYEHNKRIMWINGSNNGYACKKNDPSYMYSIYAQSWGWATWRRAWNIFQGESRVSLVDGISKTLLKRYIKESYLTRVFWLNSFRYGYVTRAWDFKWLYNVWKNDGLACTPSKNLVSNIGFGIESYHGWSHNDARGHLPTEELHWDLTRPNVMEPSALLDAYISKTFYRVSVYTIIKTYIASRFPFIRKAIRMVRNKSH